MLKTITWQRSDRPGYAVGWVVALVLVGTICWLSLTSAPPQGPDFPSADKFGHFLGYCCLSLWFGQLVHRFWPAIGIGLALVALGIGLEWLQGLMGFRHAEWQDAVANTLGVFAGWLLCRTRMRLLWLQLTRLLAARF
ncbi:MAG: hypothetical protein DHS20C11_21890 [Lysobacteraceae bacterium]|nr:MAG: hypothetical protein DHS20C11_21890 [Xanthomonadaceae bacterium]